MVDSSPDSPGIDKPPTGIIIRQQKCPEPWTCTFGISPTHYHELFPVLALDLQP
jgi:hypothetical protein